MCYLGFVYRYRAGQGSQPSLDWYTQVGTVVFGVQPTMYLGWSSRTCTHRFHQYFAADPLVHGFHDLPGGHPGV